MSNNSFQDEPRIGAEHLPASAQRNLYRSLSGSTILLFALGIVLTFAAMPVRPAPGDPLSIDDKGVVTFNLASTTGPTAGVITQNGKPLIHTFFGSDNFFAGQHAGNFKMKGDFNTASGSFAFHSNETGQYNTAFGYRALHSSTLGASNTAVGFNAMNAATKTDRSTAIGDGSLGSLKEGVNNIALGASAGQKLESGSNNIYIGNDGEAKESNMIRIGGGAHTATMLAGTVKAKAFEGPVAATNITGTLDPARMPKSVALTEEPLRIIRGTVESNATIRVGAGFDVEKYENKDWKAPHVYRIKFKRRFGGEPTVVIGNHGAPSTYDFATITGVGAEYFDVVFHASNGNFQPHVFAFIVMGPP